MNTSQRKIMIQRWLDLCPQTISLSRALSVYDRIEHAYDDPQRHFHTLDRHIRLLLDLQEAYFPDAPLDVRLALWFHDIFYLPGYGRNEAMSAEMMRIFCYGIFLEDVLDAAAGHILATVDHAASDNKATQIVCDLDLLGLASPPQEYDISIRRIRAEYGQFSNQTWAAGRESFLRNQLAKSSIFQTAAMKTLFEGAARRNLQRERATYN